MATNESTIPTSTSGSGGNPGQEAGSSPTAPLTSDGGDAHTASDGTISTPAGASIGSNASAVIATGADNGSSGPQTSGIDAEYQEYMGVSGTISILNDRRDSGEYKEKRLEELENQLGAARKKRSQLRASLEKRGLLEPLEPVVEDSESSPEPEFEDQPERPRTELGKRLDAERDRRAEDRRIDEREKLAGQNKTKNKASSSKIGQRLKRKLSDTEDTSIDIEGGSILQDRKRQRKISFAVRIRRHIISGWDP
jgi:hypothetical protein